MKIAFKIGMLCFCLSSLLPQMARADACDEALRQSKMAAVLTRAADKSLWLTSDQVLADEAAFSDWLKNVFEVFFRPATCGQDLHFRVAKGGGFFSVGTARVFNANEYLQKRISWPEWVRRLQIQEEASLDGIKAALKEARRQNDREGATRWLSAWLTQQPDNPTALVIAGNLSLEQADYAAALSHYQNVLQKNPRDETALVNHAFALAQSGQVDLAIPAFQNLLDHFEDYHFRNTTRDALRLHLVATLLKSQNWAEAEKNLNLMTTSSFEKDLFQVELLRGKKDFVAASAKLQSLLAKQPQSEMLLYDAIVLELDLKNFARAKALYTDLKTFSPETARDFAFLDLWQEPPAPDAAAPNLEDGQEKTDAP